MPTPPTSDFFALNNVVYDNFLTVFVDLDNGSYCGKAVLADFLVKNFLAGFFVVIRCECAGCNLFSCENC